MRTPFAFPVPRQTLTGMALAGILAGALAGCGGPTPSATVGPSGATGTAIPPATAVVDATPVVTVVPELTPVPGATDEPIPPAGGGGTIVIGWGTILDAVPEDFPVFPGASPTEIDDGPASGAWFAEGAAVDEVADWYRNRLEALGFETMGLSSPLEDGSRVLDTVSDLPECRIQTTFRPAGGSTMIIVLYGAGCAGGEG
ncbi:MAG TPA: hypothetical protein VES19_13465 [Candidatus Limnocylindrales bacterium]|nr:hypothetical protein [Candidatus Limnocylindrales bacterium]